MEHLFLLGQLIVKIVFRGRLPEDAQENFTDIVDSLTSLGMDIMGSRSAKRSFEDISDKIANSCHNMLKNAGINEERQVIIIETITHALEKSNINLSSFIIDNVTEKDIQKSILSNSNKDDMKYWDEKEKSLYGCLLSHISTLMIETFKSMPEFTTEGIRRLLAQMDTISEKIDNVLENLQQINLYIDPNLKEDIYEQEYRKSIISNYNYVNLFGATNLSPKMRTYSMSISYVELEFSSVSQARSVTVMSMLNNKCKHIWISGEAGSGKTTLFQWIAVNTASKSIRIDNIGEVLPVLIELRKIRIEDFSIVWCIKNTMKESTYSLPEGWVEKKRKSGAIIFLIDGFDEVEPSIRNMVFESLRNFDPEDKCKKIFSGRPHVKERPLVKKIVEYTILPMSMKKIKSFIQYWYKAVLVESLLVDEEEANAFSNNLFDRIQTIESIAKLVTNPLLCAMICALNYNSKMNLPTNKREIYEECCMMLFDKRDAERKILISDYVLSYEQKKIILSQLARWMMMNNYVVVDRENAVCAVERFTKGMDIDSNKLPAENVFEYLYTRCGILREPENNKFDFIHRTFQEYLTACEIARNDDWGFLKGNINKEEWQETIALSMGLANEKNSTEIIEYALENLNDPEKRLFTAVNYLSGAIEVNQNLRHKIKNQLMESIPPKINDSLTLSKSGNLVVPYLINKSEYSSEQRVACLRTLNHIGTKMTLNIVKSYFIKGLSIDEMYEIGELIAQFTDDELIDSGVVNCGVEFFASTELSMITIPCSIIRIFRISSEHPENLHVRCLQIMEYDGYEFFKINRYFKGLERIIIRGHFNQVEILNSVTKVDELILASESDSFDLYCMKRYKCSEIISSLKIISMKNEEYVNGKELDFLKKCTYLSLFLLGQKNELYLDYFSQIPNLESLEIGSPYLDEYVLDTSLLGDISLTALKLLDDSYLLRIDYDDSFDIIPQYLLDYLIFSKLDSKSLELLYI